MSWSLVQKTASPGTSGAGTLPGSSAAGNLLIAVLSGFTDPDTISGPSGWTQAVQGVQASTGIASIWCYRNNPGSISSATFTDSASALQDIWMAEFTTAGAAGASVATSGTGSASAARNCTATASSANASGDLAICMFNEFVFGGTWSTPSGWTVLGSDAGGNGWSFSGYQLSAAAGTLAVTGAASQSGAWAGAVVTFSVGASHSGSASLAGAGSVTAGSSVSIRVPATLAGAGAVAAGAEVLVAGTATIAGAGTVTAAGVGAPGNAFLAGAGAVAAGSSEVLLVPASIAGAGAVAAGENVTAAGTGAFFEFF